MGSLSALVLSPGGLEGNEGEKPPRLPPAQGTELAAQGLRRRVWTAAKLPITKVVTVVMILLRESHPLTDSKGHSICLSAVATLPETPIGLTPAAGHQGGVGRERRVWDYCYPLRRPLYQQQDVPPAAKDSGLLTNPFHQRYIG